MSVSPNEALEKVIFSLFVTSISHGEEKNLETMLGMGLSIEQYFEFFTAAMQLLLDKKLIDNLRYLELKQFLNLRRNNLQEFRYVQDRMKALMYEIANKQPLYIHPTNLGDIQ